MSQIEELIEDKLVEIDALEKTRNMLLARNDVVRRGMAPPVKRPKQLVGGGSWATKLEMLIGTAPSGMSTSEVVQVLKTKGISYSTKTVYGAIHLLKKNKRIRTDKERRHHVLVSVPHVKLLETANSA